MLACVLPLVSAGSRVRGNAASSNHNTLRQDCRTQQEAFHPVIGAVCFKAFQTAGHSAVHAERPIGWPVSDFKAGATLQIYKL